MFENLSEEEEDEKDRKKREQQEKKEQRKREKEEKKKAAGEKKKKTGLRQKSKMSRIMRKMDFCICKNKDTDQLCSNCTSGLHLCFCFMDKFSDLFFINKKFQASGLF